MPQKVWATGEEVLAADFNTYLQGQTVPSFTGTAQRDSQWVSPPNGAVCVTTDTGRMWQRIGGVWWLPFNRITVATRTTSAGPQLAEAAVGVSITFTPPNGRLVRLEAGCSRCNSGTNAATMLRIKEGATVIYEAQSPANSTGAGAGLFFGETIQPTGTAHTYGLYLEGLGASSTAYADATSPIYLEAWDVGAA